MLQANRIWRQLFARSRSQKPWNKNRAFLQVEALEERAVPTVAFLPVGRGPEVLNFNGQTMTQPLTSNPYALNSPKVYFIFVGPNWVQNGNPAAAVNSMIADAQAILNSSYLSGVQQYGSDGHAIYGGMTMDTSLDPLTWTKDYKLSNNTIDHTQNPVWYETGKILSNPNFSSWNPPGGDARTSPIYVVVRYTHDGTGVGGGYGGTNNFGPNDYTSLANGYTANPNVNVIDDAITSADQVDQFSWVFSHEIAERMSTGTGNAQKSTGVYEVSPDQGAQIADGEPEVSMPYWSRLNGKSGPLVTSYWSVLDQAFIIPDGMQSEVVLHPVWNGTSFTGSFLSLQQDNLYQMSWKQLSIVDKTLIDTHVESYATDAAGGVYDLTASHQVRKWNGSSNWTAVTGGNTNVTELVATAPDQQLLQGQFPVVVNSVCILASNDGGPEQVWKYNGWGTSWEAVTGTNTQVYSIAAAGNRLYMLANNDSHSYVWQYSGSGTNWAQVTPFWTNVSTIAASGGRLFMLANNGGPDQVWQYTGFASFWLPVTGTNTSIAQDELAVAGTGLYIVGANPGEPNRVYQFSGAPMNWIALTGLNTNVVEITAGPGTPLYMLAANGGGRNQVWQYNGTPLDWAYLTGTNTNATQIWVTANRLYMFAANDPDPYHLWVYNGVPLDWTQL